MLCSSCPVSLQPARARCRVANWPGDDRDEGVHRTPPASRSSRSSSRRRSDARRAQLRIVDVGWEWRAGMAYPMAVRASDGSTRRVAALAKDDDPTRETRPNQNRLYQRITRRPSVAEPPPGRKPQFAAVPEQQAQPPPAELMTASAASQHGPPRSTTARERLVVLPRCRSRDASRASSACRPAIREATSARRSAITCGSSAVEFAAVAGMTPARDLRGVVERHVEPAQVDQEPQVLDIRLAVLAVGVLAPVCAREPAGSLVEPDRVGRHPDPFRQLADPHRRSKPWSASNVKRPRRRPPRRSTPPAT